MPIDKKMFPHNFIEDLLITGELPNNISSNETLQRVENLIESLSERKSASRNANARMQNIIYLRYVSDLTYKEIGEIIGLSANRTFQICNQALRILKHPSRLNHFIFKVEEKG